MTACGSSMTDQEAKRQRCVELRDHLIELRLSDVGAQAIVPTIETTTSPQGHTAKVVVPPIDMRAHRAAMRSALGDRFLGSCQTAMTDGQVQCALGATSSAAAAACSSPHAPAPITTASN